MKYLFLITCIFTVSFNGVAKSCYNTRQRVLNMGPVEYNIEVMRLKSKSNLICAGHEAVDIGSLALVAVTESVPIVGNFLLMLFMNEPSRGTFGPLVDYRERYLEKSGGRDINYGGIQDPRISSGGDLINGVFGDFIGSAIHVIPLAAEYLIVRPGNWAWNGVYDSKLDTLALYDETYSYTQAMYAKNKYMEKRGKSFCAETKADLKCALTVSKQREKIRYADSQIGREIMIEKNDPFRSLSERAQRRSKNKVELKN